MTRREWAGLIAVSVAGGQAQEKEAAEDLLAQAKTQLQKNGERLENISVPMATEPVCIFRA